MISFVSQFSGPLALQMPSQAPFITLSPHRLDVAQRLADACSHLRVREAWYELPHVRVQLPISANGLRPWAIAFVVWFDFLLRLSVLSEVALKLLRWMKHLLPRQKSIFSWFWTARFPLSRNQLAMKLHEVDVQYISKHTWIAFWSFLHLSKLGFHE